MNTADHAVLKAKIWMDIKFAAATDAMNRTNAALETRDAAELDRAQDAFSHANRAYAAACGEYLRLKAAS